jgi:arginyl-tRNA synthetase
MIKLMLRSNPRKAFSTWWQQCLRLTNNTVLYVCYRTADFSKTKTPTDDAAFEDPDDGRLIRAVSQ